MLPPHCHTCRGCAGSLRDLAPDSLAEGRGLPGNHLAPLTLCSLTGHTFPGHWRPGHLCASPRAASPCGFPAKFHFMIFPYRGLTPPHPTQCLFHTGGLAQEGLTPSSSGPARGTNVSSNLKQLAATPTLPQPPQVLPSQAHVRHKLCTKHPADSCSCQNTWAAASSADRTPQSPSEPGP